MEPVEYYEGKFQNLQHAALATSIGASDEVDPLVWFPGELGVAHEVVNVHLGENQL